MVCIPVIHFISSLFCWTWKFISFLILSIILYISDWSLLKKICKRQKCCFFSKETFADMYFCGLCTEAMNENNPRVCQPIMGRGNTAHLTAEHHSSTKVRIIICEENTESASGHRVKQNKPGTGRQVWCDLLHMRHTKKRSPRR